ncbi:MAG: hypothetical protein HOB42_05315 [Candidatus Marinimicrobia bacterium]|nr:hypothetical protein [Candidatus Neomarinimicrobiota bacterium]MBT6637375.1 hypothetical protein [Candidatus Neomarinimicrobiota bacterium]
MSSTIKMLYTKRNSECSRLHSAAEPRNESNCCAEAVNVTSRYEALPRNAVREEHQKYALHKAQFRVRQISFRGRATERVSAPQFSIISSMT